MVNSGSPWITTCVVLEGVWHANSRITFANIINVSTVLDVGIMGMGHAGSNHAKVLSSMSEFRLSAIWTSQKSLPAPLDAIKYPDLNRFLNSSIQWIIIALPHHLLFKMGMECLHHGKNIILEKPGSLSVEEWDILCEQAKIKQLKIRVLYQNRNSPSSKSLFDFLENESIHQIQMSIFWSRNAHYYSSNWRGKHRLEGGPLYTIGSHLFDLVYKFCGVPIQIHGFRKKSRHVIETEDTGIACLSFPSHQLSIHWTTAMHPGIQETSIVAIGEKWAKLSGSYFNEYQDSIGNHIQHTWSSVEGYSSWYQDFLYTNNDHEDALRIRKTLETTEYIYRKIPLS